MCVFHIHVHINIISGEISAFCVVAISVICTVSLSQTGKGGQIRLELIQFVVPRTHTHAHTFRLELDTVGCERSRGKVKQKRRRRRLLFRVETFRSKNFLSYFSTQQMRVCCLQVIFLGGLLKVGEEKTLFFPQLLFKNPLRLSKWAGDVKLFFSPIRPTTARLPTALIQFTAKLFDERRKQRQVRVRVE